MSLTKILTLRKASLLGTLALFCAPGFAAQLPGGFFSKPAIAEVINPVVGQGARYETVRANPENAPKEVQEITIVGKDSVDGKAGFWMEFGRLDSKTGQMGYGKVLFTRADMQFHRIVIQRPGQPAMELPTAANQGTNQRVRADMEKYHVVGTESITTAAGTFECKHWKKDAADDSNSETDIWTSDKVTPFGVVKQVSPGRTMTLVSLLTDATDHITGPVRVFDPEKMKRQIMQQENPAPPPSQR